MRASLVCVALACCLAHAPAHGHHSIAGAYDTSASVTVEGVVIDFQFINPHPLLTMREDGREPAQVWVLEMDNRRELEQVGMTAGTFEPGDRVVVAGSPSRTQEGRLYIRRLERRADGLMYEQVGSRPRLRPGRR